MESLALFCISRVMSLWERTVSTKYSPLHPFLWLRMKFTLKCFLAYLTYWPIWWLSLVLPGLCLPSLAILRILDTQNSLLLCSYAWQVS